MMRMLSFIRFVFLFGLIGMFSFAYAETSVGKMIVTSGFVTASQPAQASRDLRRGSPIFIDDTIEIATDAYAQLRMTDGSLIVLEKDTTFHVEEYAFQSPDQSDTFVSNLIKGGLRVITGAISKQNPSGYQTITPVATIGIRGTIYRLRLVDNKLYAAADQDHICITNEEGEECLGPRYDCYYARVIAETVTPECLPAEPPELEDGVFTPPPVTEEFIVTESAVPSREEVDPVINPAVPRGPGVVDQRLIGVTLDRRGVFVASTSNLQAGTDTNEDSVFASDGVVPAAVIKIGGATNTNLGFVSGMNFGQWDTVEGPIQVFTNPTDLSEFDTINNDAFWVRAVPSSLAEINGLSGTTQGYTNVLFSLGAGKVSGEDVGLEFINFGDGIMVNFTDQTAFLSADAGFIDSTGGDWGFTDVVDATFTQGGLNFNVTNGEFVNGANTFSYTGTIDGIFTTVTDPADTIAGGFSFQATTDPADNNLSGVFGVE